MSCQFAQVRLVPSCRSGIPHRVGFTGDPLGLINPTATGWTKTRPPRLVERYAAGGSPQRAPSPPIAPTGPTPAQQPLGWNATSWWLLPRRIAGPGLARTLVASGRILSERAAAVWLFSSQDRAVGRHRRRPGNLPPIFGAADWKAIDLIACAAPGGE